MAVALVPKPRILPAPRRAALTPLIGRDKAIERVSAELEAGARIVTLTGPPGIGKTRTALACLERLGPAFAPFGGSRFCDISAVTTEGGFAFAVLGLLRGEGSEHTNHAEAIARVGELCESAGRMLLVLDNFEQIISAAKTVQAWCERAPELVVLVTSRERLAIAGEVVVDLLPLECPASDDEHAVAASPAAQLFVKRARDAGGAHDDPAAIAAIVRRLEGVPLAIELAAARTRLMSPRELAERLGSSPGFLERAPRHEGRHATVASAIAWSWDLLAPREQLALARCSVFAGSFSLDVAEKIVAEPDAVELLASLRDKSLVRSVADGRLALYDSIREFAAAKLRALPGGVKEARLLHARTFGQLARGFNQWRQMLDRAPDTSGTHAALRLEKENLAAAIAHVRELGSNGELTILHAELVIAAAQLHALPAEACVSELSYAFDMLPEDDASRRGLVLVARQSILASLGDYEASLADLARLEAMPRIPRDLHLLALVYQGIQLRHRGDPQAAWEAHERASTALEGLDAPRIAAMNEACMGRLRFDLGDHEGSRLHNENAIVIADRLGDSWLGALAIANLAQMEQEEQHFERAHELLSNALERLRTLGGIYEAVYSSACGDLFFEWKKYDIAREWYAVGARALEGALLTPRHAALASASCAALEAQAGNIARARALLESARRIARSAPNRVVDAAVRLHAASVEVLAAEGAEREKAIERWRFEITRLSSAGDPDGQVIATSFEARFALRIARRMLEGRSACAPHLRVERNGRWFEVDGARVDLGRRGPVRRILVALALQHATNRDRGIKQADLAELGWPGEHILFDAAATRVRVAIATLRDLGLRALLLTRDDGYVLDPAARVEVIPDAR